MSFISTVYGVDGAHNSPYRTKIQLPFGWRLHKFHRPDLDRAWHDHPNHFWTFPLSDYIEELLDPETGDTMTHVVRGWRWHYRDAQYIHRLLGSYPDQRKSHWTIVREILPEFRSWGFYVEQPDGCFIRVPWRKYIFDGVRE